MVRPPADQLALAIVGGLVLTSLVVLAPAVGARLHPTPPPTPAPTAAPTPPPAAVLVPEELTRDLQGVMVLVNDRTFGTAFQIDPNGGFLTAASLVSGSRSLRLVDNTGGSHPVRVVGIDVALGLAEIRATATDGTPLAFGMSATVAVGDSLVLLASPKVLNLRSATPVVVTQVEPGAIALRTDDLPGELGGPLVGPGGTVVAVFTRHGSALPLAAAEADLASWRGAAGTMMDLASLPLDLVLRGTNDTTAPTAGASLQTIAPTRASTTQTTLITLQGRGFVNGPGLAVRFIPVASPTGTFRGDAVTALNDSTVTLKVPAGALVQDYVVEFTNGDGSVATSRSAFSVTP
ncbi:MAG: serine protease [Candidatus Dormibacteraeota bacterium]|nr:serine protease [Candidatus Dormibacteraeota bacterium]